MSASPKFGGATKGRGAVSNQDGRFERLTREAVDDGWRDDIDLPPLRTQVLTDTARKVIARNTSPDIPFDRSLNPYRGCEHGCVYCFARPSHAYLGLSPGLDFETKLFAKHDAAALLRAELSARSYRCQTLQLGANTDPYQPIERRLGITRGVLEVLSACDHPVSITTKSDLVLRDLDILAPMAAKELASVAVSVTTLDRGLARRLEPRAPTAAKRLRAIAGLAGAGVPVTVLAAPMIPAGRHHCRSRRRRGDGGGLCPAAPAGRGRGVVPGMAGDPLPGPGGAGFEPSQGQPRGRALSRRMGSPPYRHGD